MQRIDLLKRKNAEQSNLLRRHVPPLMREPSSHPPHQSMIIGTLMQKISAHPSLGLVPDSAEVLVQPPTDAATVARRSQVRSTISTPRSVGGCQGLVPVLNQYLHMLSEKRKTSLITLGMNLIETSMLGSLSGTTPLLSRMATRRATSSMTTRRSRLRSTRR